jgi:glycosyltransferase involved in cell wall biosynthesis
MPTISVALATYNGARYLQEQLDSLAAQRHLPDELVVVDDASSDGTIGVLETFRDMAPFEVRIHRNVATLGYSANFESAIARCSGDIIFTCDQDDVWFPEKIETVIGVFDKEPEVMVAVHDHIIAHHDLTHTGVTKLGNIQSIGLRASALRSGCATALRRRWLDVALPIPHSRIPYDLWINGLADLLGVRAILPRPLLYHRRHGSNASGWIASTPDRVSWLALVRSYGVKDARDGWTLEADIARDYIRRLDDRSGNLAPLGLTRAASRAVDRLQTKIEVIQSRTALVSRARWSRVLHVLRFLRTGGYDHFFGWKSAAKDLIRP